MVIEGTVGQGQKRKACRFCSTYRKGVFPSKSKNDEYHVDQLQLSIEKSAFQQNHKK